MLDGVFDGDGRNILAARSDDELLNAARDANESIRTDEPLVTYMEGLDW